jgi:hypothetical protein
MNHLTTKPRTALLPVFALFLPAPLLPGAAPAEARVASVAPASPAQGAPGCDLSWHTVDGRGCTFNTGGGYTLGGTAGQPDAGLLTEGGYALGGGFWGGGAAAAGHKLYLPLVLRSLEGLVRMGLP